MQNNDNSNINFDPEITKNLKIAIVRSLYHRDITLKLEKNCIEALIKHGVLQENIKTFTAPGSWEIPLIAQSAAKSKGYAAIIAFGVIVKGETYHFEIIAHECARALMQLSLDYSIPITNEVLAVFNIAQANERVLDKGREGAEAALKTIMALKNLKYDK